MGGYLRGSSLDFPWGKSCLGAINLAWRSFGFFLFEARDHMEIFHVWLFKELYGARLGLLFSFFSSHYL